MKPVQQVFALVLEKLPGYKNHAYAYERRVDELWDTSFDEETFNKKNADSRAKVAKALLFDGYLQRIDNQQNGKREISSFFPSAAPSQPK
jgi:hypothetical protein